MKSIYKNVVNCCTGFILNSYGEITLLVGLYEINVASGYFLISFSAR